MVNHKQEARLYLELFGGWWQQKVSMPRNYFISFSHQSYKRDFVFHTLLVVGFPDGVVVMNPPANAGDARDTGLVSQVKKIPWRREWQPIPVFLPGECHGWRSLAGDSL